MPVLNIRNIGSTGVNSDIEPWDLPPDALSDGINYRLSANKLQSVGGTKPMAPPCGDTLGHINQSTDYSGNSTWVVCGTKNIKTYDGSSFRDIATSLRNSDPRFTNLDPTKWSSCRIGQVMFFNHPQLYPIYWIDGQGTSTPAQALQWKPGQTWNQKNYSCRVLRAHKNFLFALGMQEGPDEYRDKVWWSHPAEPDGIPYTWEPTWQDPSSIAGWVSLGRGGSIVGGESLRDSFVIYSEQAINIMDFTGDALMWRRRSVSSAAGLASQNALVEVQGIHYFISPGDIQTFDGNSISSIMHNRLRKRFASRMNVDALGNSWAAHNPAFTEIWFAVPEGTSEHPEIAYVFNYRDNNWSIRNLEREFKHAHFGVTPTVSSTSWNSMESSWDETRQGWMMSGDAPFSNNLLAVTDDEIHDIDVLNETFADDFQSAGGKVWNNNSFYSWNHSTNSNRSWDSIDPREGYAREPTIIRRTDLPIGGHELNTTITRIYPLVEGTAPIQIRVGSQQQAGGDIKWAGDYRTFIPGRDRKIDVRTTGEVHCYEIKSEGGSFFNLTGMDIEWSEAGAR